MTNNAEAVRKDEDMQFSEKDDHLNDRDENFDDDFDTDSDSEYDYSDHEETADQKDTDHAETMRSKQKLRTDKLM